jgi:hypothetical protein
MIHYMPRDKTCGEDAMEALRAIASGPMDPAMRIERDAASIASAMRMIHGGAWRFEIDHQHQIVLIRPC